MVHSVSMCVCRRSPDPPPSLSLSLAASVVWSESLSVDKAQRAASAAQLG